MVSVVVGLNGKKTGIDVCDLKFNARLYQFNLFQIKFIVSQQFDEIHILEDHFLGAEIKPAIDVGIIILGFCFRIHPDIEYLDAAGHDIHIQVFKFQFVDIGDDIVLNPLFSALVSNSLRFLYTYRTPTAHQNDNGEQYPKNNFPDGPFFRGGHD
jgi:hypothetical protein